MSCITGLHQLLYHILQLLAQKYGNDCGRCLVRSQSVIVADIGCTLTKQVCMRIYSFQDTSQYQQELDVLVRSIAGIQKIYTIIGSQ